MPTQRHTSAAPQSHGAYDGAMNVSEAEAQELLASLSRIGLQMREAEEAREAVVLRAVKAGLPRQQIAEALGVHRNTLLYIQKQARQKA